MPSLNARTIEAIEILLPPTTLEQTAISEVLTDMDLEIDSLNQKLNKLLSLKSGMIQQLLTGNVRLV